MGVQADAVPGRIGRVTIELPGETETGRIEPDMSVRSGDSPRNPTIHALFEEQAARTPHAAAIEFADRRMTYRELNERANQVACRLLDLGVSTGTLVGLCMERSPELIVGTLAILKAGGAYVPLDPRYPDKRLSYMVRDTGAPLVIAHRPTACRLAPALGQARIFWIDSGEMTTGDERAINPEAGATADDLAYVMYTSGSTGRPKGVMVPHRSVVHLVRSTNYCQFGPAEVFLQLAPISVDASTFEIWAALLNGSRLVIMAPGSPSLDEIGTALQRHRVTTAWLTADLFELMVEQRADDLRPLRQIVVDGDVLSPTHVRKALDILDNGVIVNGYGPAESTTFACYYPIDQDRQTSGAVPIGRPMANSTVHLLDDNRRPVPAGSPGELWIGGDGLARGYLNHPELTRQKFVADPFASEPGARMYRTGDLARFRPDGDLEFLGRLDRQVNISGHRIEPEEIEAVLTHHPKVRQAAVVADAGQHGEKRLVAYVVSQTSALIDVAELREYLGRHLPGFMVPTLFVTIDSLPLSPNGKLDRSALTPADPTRPITHEETAVTIAGDRT